MREDQKKLLSPGFFILFLNNYLFISKSRVTEKEGQTKRVREKENSHPLFTLYLVAVAWAGPGQSKKPRAFSSSLE